MATFRAACVQNTAERDPEPSMAVLADLIRRARDQKSDLIMTPEVCAMLEPKRKLGREKAEYEEANAVLEQFRDLAKEGYGLVINLAPPDSDGSIDASSVVMVTAPDHGSISINGTTGVITYVHDDSAVA